MEEVERLTKEVHENLRQLQEVKQTADRHEMTLQQLTKDAYDHFDSCGEKEKERRNEYKEIIEKLQDLKNEITAEQYDGKLALAEHKNRSKDFWIKVLAGVITLIMVPAIGVLWAMAHNG